MFIFRYLAPGTLVGALLLSGAGAMLDERGAWSSPADAGILYLHVPLAVGSMVVYLLLFVRSVHALLGGPNDLNPVLSSAKVGALSSTLAVVTGALWARAEWNVFWRWEDPKLVATFTLWLLFIALWAIPGHLPLENPTAQRVFALVAVGGVLLPVVYLASMSVYSEHPRIEGISRVRGMVLAGCVLLWTAHILIVARWSTLLGTGKWCPTLHGALGSIPAVAASGGGQGSYLLTAYLLTALSFIMYNIYLLLLGAPHAPRVHGAGKQRETESPHGEQERGRPEGG